VIEETKSKGLRLSQLEEKTFGFDHGEVGAYLLSSWGVPEEVVLPVQEHTKAVGKDARHADTLIVIAASALADHVESGSLHSFHSSEPARLLKEELELSEDQIAEWESAVWAKVTQMAALESRS
jgi:HD-like signal output (HDOD) protein